MHQTSSLPQSFPYSRIPLLSSAQQPELAGDLVQTFLQHLQTATGIHAFCRHPVASCLGPGNLAAVLLLLAALRLPHPGVSRGFMQAECPVAGGRLTPGQPRAWQGQPCRRVFEPWKRRLL